MNHIHLRMFTNGRSHHNSSAHVQRKILFALRKFIPGFLLAVFLAAAAEAAPTVSQQIPLSQGWNTIYLEVEPTDGKPAAVFNNQAIEMVWGHFSSAGNPRFITNVSELAFNEAGWGVFIPRGEQAVLSNLSKINGGGCYLVKTNAAITLTVSGTPVYRPIQWQTEQFNLTGFYVDPSTSVTFDDFLNLPTAPDADLVIYELLSNGIWAKVADTDSAIVKSGKAYWVYNDGTFKSHGPWSLDVSTHGGIDFGSQRTIHRLTVTNESLFDFTTFAMDLTNTNVTYYDGLSSTTGQAQWLALDEFNESIGVKESLPITLGLARQPGSAAFRHVLTLKGNGMRVRLPLEADVTPGREGLWAGLITLNKVNYINDLNATTPLPTQSEMSVNVILHLDAEGKTSLLKEAYVVGEQDATDADKINAVVLTNSSQLPNYEGLAFRDGRMVGYRLSAVTYDFAGSELDLTGTFGTTLAGTISMASNLPTHPMRHQYHPDHNDLDAFGQPPAPALPSHKREVWNMTRAFTFTFDTTNTPDPDDDFGWLTGTYAETLTGAHKRTIYLEGTFRLQRISTISQRR